MAEDFFTQMKQVISQGVSAVNQGVSDLNAGIGPRLEIGRHQVHIEGLNRQMRDIWEKLGRAVYEGWKENDLDGDAIRVQCAALSGLESQKQAREEEIARIRSEMRVREAALEEDVCPVCGVKLYPGAAFCHACGAKK